MAPQTQRPRHVFLKAAAIWLTIVPCAILNGMLREELLRPLLGNPAALSISGILMIGLILLVALLFVPRLGSPGNPPPVWKIGLLWMVLTLLFETGIGVLQGASLSMILANYNPSDGNLRIFVVLFTVYAPQLAMRLRS